MRCELERFQSGFQLAAPRRHYRSRPKSATYLVPAGIVFPFDVLGTASPLAKTVA